MIAHTVHLPGLDLTTIMRAYRDRDLARLVVNPNECDTIALRVERYNYERQSFLVEVDGQALLLSRNEDTWCLTPDLATTSTRAIS